MNNSLNFAMKISNYKWSYDYLVFKSLEGFDTKFVIAIIYLYIVKIIQ